MRKRIIILAVLLFVSVINTLDLFACTCCRYVQNVTSGETATLTMGYDFTVDFGYASWTVHRCRYGNGWDFNCEALGSC